LERKKESIQSLKEKVHSNNKEPKTYSYENVPRYHAEQLEPNQVVSVRYPSDESSKFPHFPAVKEQLSLDLGKLSHENNNNNQNVNTRPVRQKPANTFRDSQSQPSYDNYFTTRPTVATTTTTVPTVRATKSRGGNNDYQWGMKMEGQNPFGHNGVHDVTTVKPKYLNPGLKPAPTRGPVVSQGKIISEEVSETSNNNIKDSNLPEWFLPNTLKEFNDPLLPPLMPGYGAPDLYGQDLTSMVNRSKRKNIKKNNPTATPTPEKNLVKPRYEVTTYKPQFVIPANFDHLHNNGGSLNGGRKKNGLRKQNLFEETPTNLHHQNSVQNHHQNQGHLNVEINPKSAAGAGGG
jgi:hypothetical protein